MLEHNCFAAPPAGYVLAMYINRSLANSSTQRPTHSHLDALVPASGVALALPALLHGREVVAGRVVARGCGGAPGRDAVAFQLIHVPVHVAWYSVVWCGGRIW